MKLLVVDDDPAVRRVLRAALKPMGHELAEADNGMLAWRMLRDSAADVVISDWEMPEMDGLALARRIRQEARGATAYFILVTGVHPGQSDYERALGEGVDDFLLKPLDMDLLWVRLRHAERIVKLHARLRKLEETVAACPACSSRSGG